MNERIKELAEQAGITLPADTEYNGHIYRNALEKFANSIIAECQGIAEQGFYDEIDGQEINDKIARYFKG